MANNQFYQAPASMLSTFEFNPKSILESEQFPDILNYLSSEQITSIFEILSQPAHIHLVNKKGPLGGYTALHWMAIKNDLELLKFLVIKCKADVNCQANLGETPIHICIKNCNLYTIEFLAENGANLECRDTYNRSVIHWAAYTGKVILLHYFQKYHGISNYNDPDQFQQNALHIACGSGYADMIRYLIDRASIDLFAKDFNGNTCLHLAAKCGLARICWLITQERNGEAAKLVSVKNNSNQTPFDFILNERAPHFKLIRNWLRLEAKTNKWIVNDASGRNSRASLFHVSTFWNSLIQMKTERVLRFLAFFCILTIPVSINMFVVYPDDVSLVKGLIGYSTFVWMAVVIVKQKHRISHISGLQNPFFLGYFSCLFVHNYYAFYVFVLEDFNILNLYTLMILGLTAWHFYTYYKIVTVNPGFCKESVKKKDGTPYELKDLMVLNANNQRSFKDSISLMTQPSSTASIDGGETNSLYFCEHCLLVQSIPTKHCKLCEKCCLKFDHHCLYICSCVGLKNHRPFIYFLVSSILCTTIFLFSLFRFFSNYADQLAVYNKDKLLGDQTNLLYVLFSSGFYIWLAVLFIVNGFSMFMVFFLFCYQIKFISLGFTSQFPPPIAFVKSHKRMQTFLSAFLHRVDNLYTFFFESCESNQDLYYRQQSEYRQSVPTNKAIPLAYYPKNNFDENFPYSNGKTQTAINMTPVESTHQSSKGLLLGSASKSGLRNEEIEIDLD